MPASLPDQLGVTGYRVAHFLLHLTRELLGSLWFQSPAAWTCRGQGGPGGVQAPYGVYLQYPPAQTMQMP